MIGIIVSGKVTDTKDPDKLGRVKVKLIAYDKPIEVWLRILWPYASKKAGFVFLPEKDDEVLILRGAGDDIDGMFIVGALYNGIHVPEFVNPDGKNDTKLIKTRSGNKIEITDKSSEESILLETKKGQQILMTDKSAVTGFEIKNSDGTITLKMDKNGVDLNVAKGKDLKITVAGDTKINVTGDVKVDGKKNVEVKAGMGVKVQAGTNVEVKGTAAVKVTAPQVEVSGSAMVTVKGAMVKIN